MRLSYSALKMYMTCPLQFKVKYLDRNWPESADTPALRRGREVHERLEASMKDGTDPGVWTPEGLMPALHKLYKKSLAKPEFELRWSNFIGFIDVLMADQHAAVMLDWKTGQYRPDEMQADMYAMLLRRKVQQPLLPVEFHLVYVDQQKVHTVKPDEYAEQRIMSVVDVIERDKDMAPRPCFACKWCPVTTCCYNRSA